MNRPTPVRIESLHGEQTLLIAPPLREQRISDVLRHENLPLNTRCGRRGLCDGCVCELIEGSVRHVQSGEPLAGNGEPVAIRGCMYRFGDEGAVTLRVPPRSLLAFEPQVVSDFRINVSCGQDPLWQHLKVGRIDAADEQAAASGLCRMVSALHADDRRIILQPELERILPRLRGREVYVSLEYRADHWLITEVSDRPAPPRLGAAIDVGTTTAAVMLIELHDGQVLERSSAFNRQIHFGDDVLTRINLCMNDPQMLAKLQAAIVQETINPLLRQALTHAHRLPQELACIAIAGNTTMLHLLLGIDPTSMGVSPFTPAFVDHRAVPSSELGLLPLNAQEKEHTRPTVHLLPGAAAYIGADLTAGIVSTGLMYEQRTTLLVDVGTNGEVILKHGDRLLACATAAGPAFEGGKLSCGMRAGRGAISHVRIQPGTLAVETEMIGTIRPHGICGSAYVDFLAEARMAGLIGPTGRFQSGLADERMICDPHRGRGFLIATGRGKDPIVITEPDIAALLQAKAAIAAGVLTLLARAGLTTADVDVVYLAGGFGMHMNIASAIGCGLLPGFRPEQVQLVGNTSLAGAYLALLDSGLLDEMSRLREQMEIVELNLEPDFESCYIEQLTLPEADSQE